MEKVRGFDWAGECISDKVELHMESDLVSFLFLLVLCYFSFSYLLMAW